MDLYCLQKWCFCKTTVWSPPLVPNRFIWNRKTHEKLMCLFHALETCWNRNVGNFPKLYSVILKPIFLKTTDWFIIQSLKLKLSARVGLGCCKSLNSFQAKEFWGNTYARKWYQSWVSSRFILLFLELNLLHFSIWVSIDRFHSSISRVWIFEVQDGSQYHNLNPEWPKALKFYVSRRVSQSTISKTPALNSSINVWKYTVSYSFVEQFFCSLLRNLIAQEWRKFSIVFLFVHFRNLISVKQLNWILPTDFYRSLSHY